MLYLKFRAVMQCDWELDDGSWGCVYTEEYQQPLEVDKKRFTADAVAHFKTKGWIVRDGKALCPGCVGRPTDRREDEEEEMERLEHEESPHDA
jgi:hypothetical protein